MISLEQLKTFYYIATHKNLSAAAQALKIDKSSASRHLRSLESFLQRPLCIRSGHGLQLTSFGDHLLEKAKLILSEMKTLEESFSENSEEVGGIFRITSTHALIATWLTYFLDLFIHKHPKLRLEIVGSNAPLDLQLEGIDAAIRPYTPNTPRLIQVPLMRWRLSLFATQKYIDKFGSPKTVEDLDRHRLLVFRDDLIQFPPTYTAFPLYAGSKQGVPRKPFLTINSVPGMYNLVNHHVGIGCFAPASPYFQEFNFVPVLPHLVSSEVEVYYTYPESYQPLRKVQEFGTFLQEYACQTTSTAQKTASI